MISAKVCRWFSVRGRTYRTIITPEVRVVAAQEFHTMNLVWGRYLTKKFLLQHLGIRATARVFEVAPNTVLQWLVEAAEQLRAFSAYFLCDLHLEQLQLDALYAVLRDLQAGEISDDAAIKRLERSPYWVWTAMDPRSKLLVVVDVGTRTLAMAQRVVHQVTAVVAPGCVPLFVTGGLKDYATALLTHFG